jgi:signal transduction histidine kinase
MKTISLAAPAEMPSSFTSLRGIPLLLARLAWLALTLIAAGLFVWGIPIRAENLSDRYVASTGIFLSLGPSGQIVITPGVDSPAYRAGVLQGDILVAVKGKTPQARPGDPLQQLIPEAEAGTLIALTVRTGDHPPRDYEIHYGGDNAVALARSGLSRGFIAAYSVALEIAFAMICLGFAVTIFLRRSRDGLALLASLVFVLVLLGVSEQTLAVYGDQPFWRPALDLWFALTLIVLSLFFCLFPDGRFVPSWTRALIIVGIAWLFMLWLNPRLYPWKMPIQGGMAIIVAWLATGIIIQAYRYRTHSNPTQRQQTKWVLAGMIASSAGLLGQVYNTTAPGLPVPAGLPTVLFDLAGYPAIQLFKLFLPLGIAIAILRHRLWDIDLLINRALVYGALTVSVIGTYVLVVGGLGTAIQGNGNLLVSILATGLVALLVQPLRDRLQRGVNRMMYGERDDPVTVLSRLGQRLEGTLAPDAVLPSLVETVAQTLKLPYVAIQGTTEEEPDQPPTIAYGEPRPEAIRIPLVYQSEIIGQLVAAPRSPGELLNPMDRHLLENIAHQAGMAVHAVHLNSDLQRSRQRLVTAREEERRRLRRDLHDGMGPNLASQGLKLAAARQQLQNDPAAAGTLIDQVIAQNRTTVEDIRRLVYGLRPPALDELGLVAAIRDHVAGTDGNGSLQISISEPPEGLPPLSAAVEAAAYRIALEALTNVIRHAGAKHCTIRFWIAQEEPAARLQVEIQDDGAGMPPSPRSGVGTRSMRERAEEVGGSCLIEPAPGGGTRVRVSLPLD